MATGKECLMVDGLISFLFNSSFVFSLGKKSREFSSEMDLWLVPCGGGQPGGRCIVEVMNSGT